MSFLEAIFPESARMKHVVWVADELTYGTDIGEVFRMDDLPYAIAQPVDIMREALDLLCKRGVAEKRSENEYVYVGASSDSAD